MTPATSRDTSRLIQGYIVDDTSSSMPNSYLFKGAHPNIFMPDNFKDLDVVISKFEENPNRALAIARARQKLAERLNSDGHLVTLAELRLRAGFSQAKLATALGNSQPSYSMIELGKHDIMLATFEKLVCLLGVTRDELAEALKNTKNIRITHE
jgi:DNA-binding XRE family transcriptional regulator